MKPGHSLPRLLVVEDDPVSAAFLREAAAALPAEVVQAGSVAEALRHACTRRFDLLLMDANLPDGRGEALLQALRHAGLRMPALAHTATREPPALERLRQAGFDEVLCKPLAMATLHAALRRRLGMAASDAGVAADWDDAGALAALGGQQAHVAAMRGLFLRELPGQRQRIEAAAAAGDEAGVRAELHRLAASCGFVGAARIASCVEALREAPLDPAALRRLGEAVEAALASG